MIANTPLGRIGQPDDIARVALFLASDQSRWLTGERINASGGFR
jgi:3-oxoacyl-[acyl-carrier protein] reductase